MIQALQTLRGVAVISVVSLVAEIGSFKRFATSKQLMSYVGLVPSERSSGELRRQRKYHENRKSTCSTNIGRVAWSYRYQQR